MNFYKITLNILHFLGLCKTTTHISNLMFYIPSQYGNEPVKFSDVIVDDIKSQTYKELERNKKLKKWCSRLKQVYIVYPSKLVTQLTYIDGVLYWPYNNENESAKRANILDELGI